MTFKLMSFPNQEMSQFFLEYYIHSIHVMKWSSWLWIQKIVYLHEYFWLKPKLLHNEYFELCQNLLIPTIQKSA